MTVSVWRTSTWSSLAELPWRARVTTRSDPEVSGGSAYSRTSLMSAPGDSANVRSSSSETASTRSPTPVGNHRPGVSVTTYGRATETGAGRTGPGSDV